ncbi:uncharacterized protein LOC6572555 isoform X2 [Drosophila mojavensis]|uniref:Uncharacterized protein n=1 Tax=Drosophila mojavensis TaxID=7230 RepID=B4K673_DROMO|nr:uncharacterized protein LOC6572555 isoform X2 [Drosophila mojavensis]EDW14123.2 uncharacterized protein Dmoj_GI24094 [Drosophila mojavensis]
MAKKNKSKAAKKKLANEAALKKQAKEQKQQSKANTVKSVPESRKEKCVNNTDNVHPHKMQLDSIATMSTRVDDHIIMISAVQKQLAELQIKQVKLLDGCVNFFNELQGFQAQNEEEEKLLLETFLELKTKVKIVFKHYLPSQVDMLERDMKILQSNDNEKH